MKILCHMIAACVGWSAWSAGADSISFSFGASVVETGAVVSAGAWVGLSRDEGSAAAFFDVGGTSLDVSYTGGDKSGVVSYKWAGRPNYEYVGSDSSEPANTFVLTLDDIPYRYYKVIVYFGGQGESDGYIADESDTFYYHFYNDEAYSIQAVDTVDNTPGWNDRASYAVFGSDNIPLYGSRWSVTVGRPSPQGAYKHVGIGGIQIISVDHEIADFPTESILSYGALRGGITDISSSFQAAIDEKYASGGGVVLIPSGNYVMNSPVCLKPDVHIISSPAARIRAGQPLDAMITTSVGDGRLRVRDQFVIGGVWCGGGLADRIFLLRDFNNLTIEDAVLYDCQEAYIDIDGTGAYSSCYELMLRNLTIKRQKTAGVRPDGCVGIRAGAGIAGLSDSHFSDVVISGVERGLAGGFYVSKFDRVHVYSHGPTQGRLDSGFYMEGGNNQFVACQVDNPRYYGWFMGEDGSQVGHSCLTYGTDGDWLAGDAAVCVYINGSYDVVADNNRWNVQSSSCPMAAEFAGDLNGLRARANLIRGDSILSPVGDVNP